MMFEQHQRQCAVTTRQDAHVRTPSLQQYEMERYPIPMYSGDREDISHFINRFVSRAVSQQCEEALTIYDISVNRV